MYRVPVLHRLILTGRAGTGHSVQVYIVVCSIQWLLWLTTQIHRADRRLYRRRETPEVVCVHKYTSTLVCVWSHMSILFWLGSELESMIIVTTIIGVFLAALLEMDTKHTELCVVDTQLNVSSPSFGLCLFFPLVSSCQSIRLSFFNEYNNKLTRLAIGLAEITGFL